MAAPAKMFPSWLQKLFKVTHARDVVLEGLTCINSIDDKSLDTHLEVSALWSCQWAHFVASCCGKLTCGEHWQCQSGLQTR